MVSHSHRRRWKWFSGAVLFTALVLMLWLPLSAFNVPAGIAATLPPTWTPIPSLTPSQTPEPTLTPSPTRSLTPAPTLTADELCEQFRVTVAPVEALHVDYQGQIGFSWEYAPEDSVVVLSIIPLAGGDETLIGFLPYEGFNALFALNQLPGWGTYQWTLTVFREGAGELCPTAGTFTRDPWWIEPLENPLAPPFAS